MDLGIDISHWFYKIYGHYLFKYYLFHIVSLVFSCSSRLVIRQIFALQPPCLLTPFILFTSVSVCCIHICFSFMTVLFGSLSNLPDGFWCLLYPHHTFNPLIHFSKYFYINWFHSLWWYFQHLWSLQVWFCGLLYLLIFSNDGLFLHEFGEFWS